MWKKSPYANEDLPHPPSRDPKAFFRDALIPRWVRVKTYTYWPFLLRGGSQTSCRRSVWWLPADPERALDDPQRQARFRPLRRCRAAARRGERESSARAGRSQPQGGWRSSDPPPASAAQRAGLAPLAQRGAKRGWEARRRGREPNPSLEERAAGAKAGGKGSAVENAGRESVRWGGGQSQRLLPEGETRAEGPCPDPRGSPPPPAASSPLTTTDPRQPLQVCYPSAPTTPTSFLFYRPLPCSRFPERWQGAARPPDSGRLPAAAGKQPGRGRRRRSQAQPRARGRLALPRGGPGRQKAGDLAEPGKSHHSNPESLSLLPGGAEVGSWTPCRTAEKHLTLARGGPTLSQGWSAGLWCNWEIAELRAKAKRVKIPVAQNRQFPEQVSVDCLQVR